MEGKGKGGEEDQAKAEFQKQRLWLDLRSILKTKPNLTI
jgi:hypothetical protein